MKKILFGAGTFAFALFGVLFLHAEYVESAKKINALEEQISQVKNDWDIYNYEGEAVTGAWLKLHLGFEVQDAERNFGYWLFK